MSLDYDLTAVMDQDKYDPALTTAMIFATMMVGMGEITEANAPKFYGRLFAFERATGSTITRNGDGTDRPTTPADVRAFIGLKTNVFPTVTDAQYARKLLRWATDDAKSKWDASLADPQV